MESIKQGDIIMANLNPVKGHEQAGYRPVVILQNDILNEHLSTVTIAPITKNLNAKGLFTTYFLSKTVSKLEHDSVVLLFQIRTIDKKRLKKRINTLAKRHCSEIKRQLHLIF